MTCCRYRHQILDDTLDGGAVNVPQDHVEYLLHGVVACYHVHLSQSYSASVVGCCGIVAEQGTDFLAGLKSVPVEHTEFDRIEDRGGGI